MPEVAVAVGATGERIATRRLGGSGTWTCRYYAMHAVDPSAYPGSPDFDAGPITPTPEQVVMLICVDEADQVRRSDWLVWTPAAPFGGLDLARRAAEEARRRLPLPDPAVGASPPPGAPHLVGIPTWFWTDTPWTPLAASATLGGVTATVTATPVELLVDPGDGTPPLACPDGGTPYRPDQPAAQQRSTCAHTYERRSAHRAGGTHPASLTITWHVTWAASTGEAGDLGAVARTSPLPVQVLDAQALIG